MNFRANIWLTPFLLIISSLMADTDEKSQNIIVCISENHAASLLGSLDKLGSSLNPTPNLSTIALSGFSHPLAYCTNASRGNSAFSLLTGLPKQSDLKDFDHSRFLAKYFQSQGYQTAFFGSWTWENKPQHFGFEYWYILNDSEIFFNPMIKDAQTKEFIEGHSTDIISDLVIRWLRKSEAVDKPFFIVVSYNSMNRPWIPPVRMINNYNDEWFEVPENFFTNFVERTPANKYQSMNISTDLDPISELFLDSATNSNLNLNQTSVLSKNLESMNDEQKSAWILSWKPQNEAFARESLSEESSAIWKYQRFLKNYLRCLLAMDENIGRLFEFIQSQNIRKSHLIYTSERGRFIGEFGWFGSEWMYESSARIPLIYTNNIDDEIYHIPSDQIWLDTYVYNFLKDLHVSKVFQHNSPDPGTGYVTPKDEFYFSHHKFDENSRVSPHHGFRKGRYKIIHYYPFDEWEFYDLLTDPMENRNLYHSHVYQNTIEDYKILLQKAEESYNFSPTKFKFSEKWKRNQRSPNKKIR